MKKMMLVTLIALTGTTAFAGTTLSCKKSSEASGQGYEVKASAKKAILIYKGQKVASLTLKSGEAAKGDQRASIIYSERPVNGYQVEVKTGGYAGNKTAIVSHGGVSGYLPLVELSDCR